MPIDPNKVPLFQTGNIFLDGLWLVIAIGMELLFILYFIFSLIVVRQVNLMTDTLITTVAPTLRFLAVIHAGVALGVVILFLGLLF